MSFFMNMWPCCPRERCFIGVEFALSIPTRRRFNGDHENVQSKKTEAIKKNKRKEVEDLPRSVIYDNSPNPSNPIGKRAFGHIHREILERPLGPGKRA